MGLLMKSFDIDDDPSDEFNGSLRLILKHIISNDGVGFISELGLGDAQIFDEYFMFFQEHGYVDQSNFIRDLIIFIRDGGNKSFEETYLLKERATILLDKLEENE
jgi:hypothetical protein